MYVCAHSFYTTVCLLAAPTFPLSSVHPIDVRLKLYFITLIIGCEMRYLVCEDVSFFVSFVHFDKKKNTYVADFHTLSVEDIETPLFSIQ